MSSGWAVLITCVQQAGYEKYLYVTRLAGVRRYRENIKPLNDTQTRMMMMNSIILLTRTDMQAAQEAPSILRVINVKNSGECEDRAVIAYS